MKPKRIPVGIILWTGLCLLAAGQEYKVVAHAENPVKSISAKDLYKIFTGRTGVWEDGERITVIIQKSGNYHRHFARDIMKMKGASFLRFWKSKIFTGRAPRLKIADNSRQVIQWVSEIPGAIGYINNEAIPEEIREVRIITR